MICDGHTRELERSAMACWLPTWRLAAERNAALRRIADALEAITADGGVL